jgi:hypothetical protein
MHLRTSKGIESRFAAFVEGVVRVGCWHDSD